MDPDDHELLRQYAHESSQAAFAALVERHLGLVYSAARRQVSSAELAEETAQRVFLDLAREAGRFKARVPVAAWLFLVTRRTAIDLLRRESRRQNRERAAVELSVMDAQPSPWSQVEPLLDEAVEALSEADRHAILLRFFENKSLREIGAELGASEDAAQKRVSRALERLRDLLLRRGVAVTAAGLATDLSAHALGTAPATLGPAIAASAATLAAGKTALGAASLLTMTTLQKTALVALAAVAVGGLYEASARAAVRREIAAQQSRIVAERAELAQLRRERAAAEREIDAGQHRVAARVAQIAGDEVPAEAEMQAWLARVKQLKQIVAERTELAIPELQLLGEQDWFVAGRNASFDTDGHIREVLNGLRQSAKSILEPKLTEALQRYAAEHGGMLPEDPIQLGSVSELPAAILARYEMAQAGPLDQATSDWLIDERSPVDPEHDRRLYVAAHGSGQAPFDSLRPQDLRCAMQAFAAAHPGREPATPAELAPFFPQPLGEATMKAFLQSTPEALVKRVRSLTQPKADTP